MTKPKVLILGYGGTIAMVPNPKGTLVPATSIDEIVRVVPYLQEASDATYVDVENRDSTNITPAHWTSLSHRIADACEEYDGVIVTHGTDTMAYTASAVALALGANLPIPVVFTGSQKPLVAQGTDARFNLENAMNTVIAARQVDATEVMITFSDRVLRGARAVKTSEADFRAFDSPAFPHLARINATGITFIPKPYRAWGEKPWFGINSQLGYKPPRPPLDPRPHFQRGILAVELVPGMEPGILIAVLRSGTCQGLLLKSFGAGNVPSLDEYSMLPVIQAAVKMKIPVAVSTKFVGGNTHMDMYEPGQAALDAGAIPTGDMTDVAAQVKLMWAMAQGHRDPDDLRRVMSTSYVGEVTA